MRYLFDPEGMQALHGVLFGKPLLAFDFDGTLAPISDRPEQVRVPDVLAAGLQRLSGLCPVAVITGRSVADVVQHLRFEPHFIIGNHGAEDAATAGGHVGGSGLDGVRARLSRCAEYLQAAGVSLEDKGLSLALHYRLAIDRQTATRRIEEILAGVEQGVRVFGGKCVVNVVPADAPDKADAIHRLVQRIGCDAAVFVGDDVNDEPVYARAAPNWLTVRIGRDDPQTRARFFLKEQGEMERLLGMMTAVLEAG